MWAKRILLQKVNAKCMLGIGVLLDEAARSPGGPQQEELSARQLHLSQQKVTFSTSNAVKKRMYLVPVSDINICIPLDYCLLLIAYFN